MGDPIALGCFWSEYNDGMNVFIVLAIAASVTIFDQRSSPRKLEIRAFNH